MKTMKNLTLKLAALLLVFFFAANVADAQVANGDYSQYDPLAAAPNDIDYLTLKTGNTIMGYYAQPDPIYHPGYVTPGWALTADFIWNWSFSTQPAGLEPLATKPGAANYVQIEFQELGTYELDVEEEASAAFGACASAVTRTITIELVAPPTAQFAAAQGDAGACGDLGIIAVDIEITENVPDGLARYAFRVNEYVETITAGDVQILEVTNNDNFVSLPLVGKGATTGGTSPNFEYSFNTSDMVVHGSNQRTRYTYTLIPQAGVTGPGIVSAISHKSDYISGGVNAHPFGTRTTVVFILNPAPVTGPIYHIPNNFRF